MKGTARAAAVLAASLALGACASLPPLEPRTASTALTGTSDTSLGQAVAVVCDTFRQRDEQVSGVVVISDGQDNGTVVTPLQAGRKAAAMHVPVYAVGVGDPRSPRNIHVGNLRAKEVVLARDTAGALLLWHGADLRLETLRTPPELFLSTGTEQCATIPSGCYQASQYAIDFYIGDDREQLTYGQHVARGGYVLVHAGYDVGTAQLQGCDDGTPAGVAAELWAAPTSPGGP